MVYPLIVTVIDFPQDNASAHAPFFPPRLAPAYCQQRRYCNRRANTGCYPERAPINTMGALQNTHLQRSLVFMRTKSDGALPCFEDQGKENREEYKKRNLREKMNCEPNQ